MRSRRAGSSARPSPALDRSVLPVFAGLMLGMFVSSLNLTLVAPAMPAIVAELGGIDRYSWIALSSMLASTVVVPIAGKLGDSFGRKPLYMGGIAVFMTGSVLAGLAPTFGWLVAARAISGIGMGTMMPLSQAIVGDIIPPRERGKYQGLMGGVFGVASIVGPALGGVITHHLSWRWLFFVNVPFGLAALAVIRRAMHVRQAKRPHAVDALGIAALTGALTSLLLATQMTGGAHPARAFELGALGVLLAVAFVLIETRAEEPVLPLSLWANPVFTLSNLANMGVAMAMFGAIYFVPVFVQGVIGDSAAGTGTILVPLMLSMVAASVVNGQVMTRTGRYKLPLLVGLGALVTGFWLLSRMDVNTSGAAVARNMVLVGIGLGAAMQTYTLIVQNAVPARDLGVATATTQLFRSIGGAVGVAVMGSVMTHGLVAGLARQGPGAALRLAACAGATAGAALHPAQVAGLTAVELVGIRAGIADALHGVFLAALPVLAGAFVATCFIRELPLRHSTHGSAAEAGKEVLVELNQAGAGDAEPVLEPRVERPRRQPGPA